MNSIKLPGVSETDDEWRAKSRKRLKGEGMDLTTVRDDWDKLAKDKPIRAMLPAGMGHIKDVEALFAFGKREIDEAMHYIESHQFGLTRNRALDFGCGLGRSTQALGDHFAEVYGVDIAPAVIELAEHYNRHPGRCKYLVNQASDLRLFKDQHFDFIWCYGVLHLMEPRYFLGYLREFFRVLVPGGLMVFHQAAGPDARTLRGFVMRVTPHSWWSAYRRKKYGFAVHGMTRKDVVDEIHRRGGSVLSVEEDQRTPGPNWLGFQYYVRG